jgi:hypothetical protein
MKRMETTGYYISCPTVVRLFDIRSGAYECFQLEGYHNYYAVYENPKTGLRVLIYVGICQGLPPCQTR